ncbi:lipoprotein-anchoring transpeptidase ErfK/SrfK [Sphingopyxis sp. OAS728]|uniref:L,D-transpeptidase family protein n=1 Tax=Sphingopyxis sp. OAS728 TaxID=2663823 RepID=UPI0019EDC1E2|nr:L,D-transpeptidase family protein [Sphingopyxis sp. OAS728]MBE1525688.1 lipoprotein-anchoring transpeptidase ErfK/SrfK [Sphingopyxis sp. OAS728]
MKPIFILPWLLLVAGCNAAPDGQGSEKAPAAKVDADSDSLRFEDAKTDAAPFTDPPILRAQVLLDHLGLSPGVIDGKEGQSYVAALRGFQEAQGLEESGKLDAATEKALQQGRNVPATRLVVIPAGFAKGPFVPAFPKDAADQSKLPALGYRNLTEALAERFHTTPETLVALNSPSTLVGAGRPFRVPNIPDIDRATLGEDARGWNGTLERLGVAPTQVAAAKVVVDKSEGVLKVYDDGDKLVAQFPATMGSSHDPLPIGKWKIQGVSRNPDFHYNPKLFWDVSNNKEAVLLQPGPNSPVGVVWLDLNKPHYGIHGTSEPHTIGRAESHGCVRLTNWDAARLAQMVKPGTPAIFQN